MKKISKKPKKHEKIPASAQEAELPKSKYDEEFESVEMTKDKAAEGEEEFLEESKEEED